MHANSVQAKDIPICAEMANFNQAGKANRNLESDFVCALTASFAGAYSGGVDGGGVATGAI
jgi:hypothetical protein